MKCNKCSIDKLETEFYKKRKMCKTCAFNQRKCEHNKRKSRCKECDGNQICKHDKRKDMCKECKGSAFCQHQIEKTKCKDCGGSSICEHNRQRQICKECNGVSICEHKRIKSQCKECNGSGICEHNNYKSLCKKCNGTSICKHYKQTYYCIECSPNSKAFCTSCKLFMVKKKNNYLCSYCNPDKPIRQKTKELKVKTFLEEQGYKFIHNRKCNLDNSCQTYFPDFLIDKGTFFLIIECDEDAHSSYPIDCEKIRENNICFALGLPCVFIRFNPDKKGIKMKTKQKVLKSYIDYYFGKEKSDNEVCYLFY